MKRNLYLIGAGEFAREIESWVSLDVEFQEKWNIKGFLDKNLDSLNGYPSDFLIKGVPEEFSFKSDDAAIMCIANPKIKKRIVDSISEKVEFITYISSKAIIGKYVKIGKGSVVCPNTIISTNTLLGDFITLNLGCNVGHDCLIGNYSSFMSNIDLGGNSKIGKNVFLGTKATVIPKIRVVDNIIIGAGAVVVRNLKKEGTYFGNPAILLKF